MNRIIFRISIKPSFWILPLWWRNHYVYRGRRELAKLEGLSVRAVWLCFDLEYCVLPKGVVWNPDGTHLYQQSAH